MIFSRGILVQFDCAKGIKKNSWEAMKRSEVPLIL